MRSFFRANHSENIGVLAISVFLENKIRTYLAPPELDRILNVSRGNKPNQGDDEMTTLTNRAGETMSIQHDRKGGYRVVMTSRYGDQRSMGGWETVKHAAAWMKQQAQ